MRRLLLCLVITLGGCDLFGPEEFWCAKTYYWSLTDSIVAADSAYTWRQAEPEPDSVVIEWSENGKCDHGDTAGGT